MLAHPLTESAINTRHPASVARRVRELLNDDQVIGYVLAVVSQATEEASR